MHLCTYVIKEGDDGEVTSSETPSRLSYTLRYVSFEEVGRVCRVALRVGLRVGFFFGSSDTFLEHGGAWMSFFSAVVKYNSCSGLKREQNSNLAKS